MKYVNVGSTGLRVSRICLGMMSYGDNTERAWAQGEDVAEPIVRAAVDGGVTFFDTADAYNGGTSEIITGRLLAKMFASRDDYVLATKVYFPTGSGENDRGLSRKHILSAIDASLRRLGTDYVDLYQIHRWDPGTPAEETMQALNDVVRSGKARYLGASSMFAWQFAKAQHTAERNGWTRFASMQDHYNLIYREEEREMIPQCLDQDRGGVPVEPAGPRRAGRQPHSGGRAAHHPGRQRPVPRLAVQPAGRLRRGGPGGRGRGRTRRACRAGRAGLAAAQARRHGPDRRRHPARPPPGRAGRRAALAKRRGTAPAGGAVRPAPGPRPLVAGARRRRSGRWIAGGR